MDLLVRSLLQVCSKIPFGSRSNFILTTRIAHVSRDGRDLAILSEKDRVVFIQDFEPIYRGETTLERAALVLGLRPEDISYGLGFAHGHICVATVRISQTSHVISLFTLVCRFTGSISSPLAVIFRQKLCSCDPPAIHWLVGRVLVVACSSQNVAYILRGKIQGVGRIFHYSTTWKTPRNFHLQQLSLVIY
jgi:hypothetical protein